MNKRINYGSIKKERKRSRIVRKHLYILSKEKWINGGRKTNAGSTKIDWVL